MNSLFYFSESLLLASFFVLLLLAAEVGYRWGHRRVLRTPEPISSHLTHEASALGVLALILAFTFSMAVARFDARRATIIDEANAIGTAALRTDFLPPPFADEAKRLLLSYAEARVALYDAGADEVLRAAANALSEDLHQKIWSIAVQAVGQHVADVPAISFAQSVNGVIDVYGVRKATYYHHIPDVIYFLICGVGVVAFGLSCVASGLERHRTRVPTAMMAVLVLVVVFLIADLDRPQRGLLRIGDQSMTELVSDLRAGLPK